MQRCALLLSVLSLAGCASTGNRTAGRWAVAPSIADSIRTEQLAPGVRLHHLVRNATPLRAHVLDIDLSACVSVRAVKGGETAVGRTTTSDLLRSLPAADHAIAAVNADFFLFAPPGVPVGALVQSGKLIAGPIDRPVLSFDTKGRPSIGVLTTQGTITTQRGVSMRITSWNRPTPNSVGVVDAAWGQALDSLSRPGAMQLVPIGAGRYRIAALPEKHTGQAVGDTMMLVGIARASLIEHDTVHFDVSIGPSMPYNAVGGRPLLVHDSVIAPIVDTDGAESFRGVNPRTAAGFADKGRRLLLVVIDGRQPGYSAGTSTRATAELLRDLGAREAINLDGGGSSAMVVRDVTTGAIRVINKPSDAVGERPVADALAVQLTCRGISRWVK